MSVTGKKLSESVEELYMKYGEMHMAEYDWALTETKKQALSYMFMTEKKLPEFGLKIIRTNYMDGCKVYFEDGWVILRFSGTEPRVRIFAESRTEQEAEKLVHKMASFAGIE